MKSHILTTLILVTTLQAAAQNAVQNSNFDLGLASWTVTGPGTIVSDPAYDCCGSASASAARFGYGGSITRPVLSQCVGITASAPYEFGLWIGYGSGQAAVTMSLYFFSTADCSGIALPPIASISGQAPPHGWTQIHTSYVAPTTSRSALVWITHIDLSGAHVFVDRVYLGPPGTTPVTLQSFTVD